MQRNFLDVAVFTGEQFNFLVSKIGGCGTKCLTLENAALLRLLVVQFWCFWSFKTVLSIVSLFESIRPPRATLLLLLARDDADKRC